MIKHAGTISQYINNFDFFGQHLLNTTQLFSLLDSTKNAFLIQPDIKIIKRSYTCQKVN